MPEREVARARAVRLDVRIPSPEGAAGDEVSPTVLPLRADSWSDLPASVERPQGGEHRLHLERLTGEGGLRGCLACGHEELYTRKDFPPALGIGIVVVAALLVPLTPRDWRPFYPSLVAAALIDFVLVRLAPDVVLCYVCGTQHRGFPTAPRHPRFDRTIEERLKYGKRAVMGSEMRPGGTADAPEPEH